MTLMNGAVRIQRKNLASQLDRLDTILDALSDGLNEAVATTVEQAVGTAVSSAVQAVLTELLTNPVVLARLRDILGPAKPSVTPVAQVVPPTSSPVRYSTRFLEHCQRAKEKLASLATQARRKVRHLAGMIKVCCSGLLGKAKVGLSLARPYSKPLLLATSVGVLAGATAYFAGPWFAAGAAWVAGFATTLGVQTALTLRRLLQPATWN